MAALRGDIKALRQVGLAAIGRNPFDPSPVVRAAGTLVGMALRAITTGVRYKGE